MFSRRVKLTTLLFCCVLFRQHLYFLSCYLPNFLLDLSTYLLIYKRFICTIKIRPFF